MLPTSLSPIVPDNATNTQTPGGLLGELERRQDEVLEQLDDLEAKIRSVLQGLNVEVDDSDLE